MLARATLMNTVQPMDIVALDKGKGKEKGKVKKVTRAMAGSGKTCGQKGHRKRDCRKRIRDQGGG